MTYTEAQIRIEALVELNNSSTGELTTSELIRRLEDRLKPTGHDAQIVDGRDDTYFSQKVRNLVSHRNSGTGLCARGFVTYDPNNESLAITPEGRNQVI